MQQKLMDVLKRKNILFVSHTYSSFEKSQIEYLSKYFNQVYVIVRYKPIAEVTRFLPIRGGENHTFSVVFNFKNKPDNVRVFPIRLWYLPFDFWYIRIGDYAFRQADKIIAREGLRFDFIFSFFFWTSGYIGNRLKDKYGVPHLTSGRGEDVYVYPFRNEQWKNKILTIVRQASAVTTVSRKNESCLRQIGFDKKVYVIPNGYFPSKSFPLDKIEIRKKLSLPPDRKIILSVGGLVKVKGHRHLIEAMAEVAKEYPDSMCLIIGDGDLRSDYETLINKLKLDNHVHLLGYKRNEEINDWINACDVFALPSLGEGYPNVLNECLAAGRPFVGTIVGAVPDVIQDDNIGLLCEPGNSFALAKKLIDALGKTWNRQKILDFAQSLNYENVAKQYLEIIGNLQEAGNK